MKLKKIRILSFLLVVLLLFGIACDFSAPQVNILPKATEQSKQTLFNGVTYSRLVYTEPRPMVIHVVIVDLKASGIKLLVTPGDPKAEHPLKARTTSEFLSDFGVQLAINGDAFTPWFSSGPLGYYPHSGDPVTPTGFAASKGTIYTDDTDKEPTLYLYKNDKASINDKTGKIFNAISGTRLLVNNGRVTVSEGGKPHPRTAVGINRSGNKLIIIVVDGRQPSYSEGATLAELAELLVDNNAFKAINLDGGGSSTLVVADENGNPNVLNSPIHQGIPGNERPVANHLGIFAKPK